MLGTIPRKQKRDETISTIEHTAATDSVNGAANDSSVTDTEEESVKEQSSESIVTPEKQAIFKSLLVDYFKGVEKHLLRFTNVFQFHFDF